MRKKILKTLPICLMVALLGIGCAQQSGNTQATASATSQKQADQVYEGKVVGKSKKTKTISITVGKGDKAETLLIKFDAGTKGVKHAAKGHAVIIAYEMRNGEPWATVVKPTLVKKLPEGVTEIKTAELKALMEDSTDFVLIDARPAKQYTTSHIAGAVNLPAPSYKERAASVLPQDKNQLLILYCGGPT